MLAPLHLATRHLASISMPTGRARFHLVKAGGSSGTPAHAHTHTLHTHYTHTNGRLHMQARHTRRSSLLLRRPPLHLRTLVLEKEDESLPPSTRKCRCALPPPPRSRSLPSSSPALHIRPWLLLFAFLGSLRCVSVLTCSDSSPRFFHQSLSLLSSLPLCRGVSRRQRLLSQ